jgi:glycosyltransferase involved in cell wall biosynthesis
MNATTPARLLPQCSGHVVLFVDFQRGSYAAIGHLYTLAFQKLGLHVETVQTPETKDERIAAEREYRGCIVFHHTLGRSFRPIPEAINIALPYHEWSRYPAPWCALLNSFDAIWVPSRHLEQLLKKSGVHAPVLMAPPALTLENIPEKTQWEAQQPFQFFYCGEPHFRKGHHLLMEGFMKAFPKTGEATLTIKTNTHCHWDAPRKDIKLIKTYLSRNAMLELYAEFDGFVSASLGEGLGLPLAEAIAAKLPVACNNWGGHADIVCENGYFNIPHKETEQPFCSIPEYYTPGQKCGFSSVLSVAKTLRRMKNSSSEERKAMSSIAYEHLHLNYGILSASQRIANHLSPSLDAQHARPHSPHEYALN